MDMDVEFELILFIRETKHRIRLKKILPDAEQALSELFPKD
jgi:hypothetical protein